MSNYTKTTNFTIKDSLATGDASKRVLGAEIDTEFTNIATAIATKQDTTTAAAGRTALSILSAVKSANESVASSTTLQDDGHLTLAITATGLYKLELYLQFNGPASNGLKFRLNYSGTLTGGRAAAFGLSGGSSTSALLDTTTGLNADVTQGTVGTGVVDQLTFIGYLNLGTTGTLRLQWAQSSSNATAVTLYTGSYLKVTALN